MNTPSRSAALDEATESLLGRIADEYHGACRRGETPNIEEYAARHPQLADVIRQVLPAMLALPGPRGDTHVAYATEFPGGQDLGDFRLLRLLGRGGMGIVYEAIQHSLGRRVALKVLPLASMLDERNLRRFHNEARAAGALQHPNIVSVFGVGCERGVHYYAMQLIDGLSLAEILRRWDAPATTDAPANSDASTAPYALLSTRGSKHGERHRAVARLGIQAAEALAYAHREGVIHRDIKPSNLLLDRQGAIWIADFGLARMQSGGDVTHTGDTLGTLRYMSPEQFTDSKVVDQRTDVYSLGLTLYELLALRPAFDHAPREQLIRKILEEEVTPPRQLDVSIPPDLETIVLKAVRKEPGDRYATAGELALDLRRFLDDRPIQARRHTLVEQATRWARRRRGLVWSAAGVVLLALALVSVAWRAESARRRQAVQTAVDLNLQLYTLKVALAQEAIEHQRVSEAIQQLNTCPTELRGWEWRYLMRLTNQSRKTLHPHEDRVSFVQFSPDGRLFLTAGHDGKLTVWDARTEQLLWTWRSAHVATGWGLVCASFSPNSQRIAVGDYGGVVTLLDARTGGPLFDVQVGDDQNMVRSIAFSPDGSEFVTGGGGGILAVYRTANGEPVWREVTPEPQQIFSVDYHPGGEQIATCTAPENVVKVWDAKSGRLLRTLTDPSLKHAFGDVAHGDIMDCARYSPDGKTLASAADDRTLKLWNAETGELLRVATGHTNWLRWLDFSPDGQWIATASRDSTIGIWRADSLELYTLLRGHSEYVYCLDWSPDGTSLISCSSRGDYSVMLWDAAQGPGEWRLSGDASLLRSFPHEDAVTSLAISRDPSLLCAGHQGGAIGVWDLGSGQELANLATPDEVEVSAIAVTPDGGRVVAGKSNGRIDVWKLQWDASNKLATTQLDRTVRLGVSTRINAIVLSAAEDLCLAALSDGSLVALETARWRERFRVAAHGGECRAVVAGPDGALVATCGDDGLVKLWSASTGELQGVLDAGSGRLRNLDISADGTLLVSGGDDGRIHVWDLTSRMRAHAIPANMGSIRAVTFHPAEPRLASAGDGASIRLWGCRNGQTVLNLRPQPDLRLHGREVLALAFSPDGDCLAVGMEDGSIRLWDSRRASEVLSRRRHAVSAAKGKVDALRLTGKRYAEVVAQLAADTSAMTIEKSLALEIAAARRPLDPVIARRAALSVEAYRVIAGADPTEAELCQVLATFEAALDRQPDDDWLLLASAWAQCRRLKYEEALELLRRGEEASRRGRDTGNPAITAAMAYLSAKRGDLEAARNQLRRAQTEARWPMWKDSREQATIDAFEQAAIEAVGKLPPATVSGREPAGGTTSPDDEDSPTDQTHSTRPAGDGDSGG